MNELALAAFAAARDEHAVDRVARSARFAAFCGSFDARAFLAQLGAHGVRWIARSDPRFPSRLRSIHDPPPGLFVRGSAALELLERTSVAIVGARSCSDYGAHVARSFAEELARAGVVVVSGLARGVDGWSHRGAIEGRGVTIAVLGCGIDRDYPQAHAPLAARIAETGHIVSEYPPGVAPAPWRFPARNRIVAGLANATVVVEARKRSGALITADLALEEGREVLAVPGEITTALSAGTNALLRAGATPATSAADVLAAVGIEPPTSAPPEFSAGPRRCSRPSMQARRPRTRSHRTRTWLRRKCPRCSWSSSWPARFAKAPASTGGDAAGVASFAVKTTSYWLEEPTERLQRRRTSNPVDVVVIGAGVTGCSCALTLSAQGMRVRVHEARVIAGGASGRNGGFALRGGAGAYDHARGRLGHDGARRLWRLSEQTLDRLEELADDAFRRVGSLRLAADDAERAELVREYTALREDGFAVEWVDDLPRPLDRLFRGALRHPTDGSLQPARWVRRLAQRASEAGAEFVESSRVEIDDVDADTIVIAADGLTSALLPELGAVVRPVRGQVLVTEPLDELLFAQPHYSRAGYDYWQQLPDRRLLVGGKRDASFATENTDVEETTPLIQERLEELVVELVGRRPEITHRWSGIWGTTPDLLPLAGRVPGRRGVWVAGGYSGHGNVLGLACGELVGRAILGEELPELATFAPARLV